MTQRAATLAMFQASTVTMMMGISSHGWSSKNIWGPDPSVYEAQVHSRATL